MSDNDDQVIRIAADAPNDGWTYGHIIATDVVWGADLFNLQIASTETGETIGRLYEEDGMLKFEGNLDESARLFFEWIVRHSLSERATAPLPPEYPDAPGLGSKPD